MHINTSELVSCVIEQSSMIWYFINNCDEDCMIWFRSWTPQNIPIADPHGLVIKCITFVFWVRLTMVGSQSSCFVQIPLHREIIENIVKIFSKRQHHRPGNIRGCENSPSMVIFSIAIKFIVLHHFTKFQAKFKILTVLKQYCHPSDIV